MTRFCRRGCLALATLSLLAPFGAQAQVLTPGTPGPAAPLAPGAPGPTAPLAPAAPATPGGAGGEGMSEKERQVLERIRQMKVPRWRTFGACRYDWAAWRLGGGGVRATAMECGNPPEKGNVAVHCETLRLNRRIGEGPWEPWRLPRSLAESPTTGGEDLMVAALCANVKDGAPPPVRGGAAGGRSGSAGARGLPPPPPPAKPKTSR